MSEIKNMTFSMNELVAIYSSLESQIEDCEEYLANPDFPLNLKTQINDTLRYSKSARSRLDNIFKEHHFNPYKN